MIGHRAFRSALVALLLGLPFAAAIGADEIVGSFGSPNRLTFTGNQVFTSEGLREAAAADLEARYAAHRLNSLDDYLRTLGERVVEGYRYAGFPEARVSARLDAETGRIAVECFEGRRYRAAPRPIARPADSPAAERLAQSLLEPTRPDRATQHGFHHFDGRLLATWLSESGQRAEPSAPKWRPGEPAHFDTRSIAALEDQTRRILEDLGYYFAKFRLAVVPDPESDLANLEIDVEELGPAAEIGEIEVEGADRIAAEAISRFLGIKPGMPIDLTRRTQWAYALWRCGRFVKSEIVEPARPSPDGKTPLKIKVEEASTLLPLDEEYSREIATLLKARDWFADLYDSGEDLQVRLDDEFGAVKLIFSPRRGLMAQYWLPEEFLPDEVREQPANLKLARSAPDYALFYADGKLGIYNYPRVRKIECPAPLFVTANFMVGVDKFAFGLGGKTRASAERVMHVEFDLPPANVVIRALDPKHGSTFEWRGNILEYDVGTAAVRIDSTTGRVVEIVPGDGSQAVRISFAPRLLAEQLERLESRDIPWSDDSDPRRSATSLVQFVCGELALLLEKTPDGPPRKIASALRKLADRGALRPLDCFLRERGESDGATRFYIPDRQANSEQPPARSSMSDQAMTSLRHYFLQMASPDSRWWMAANEWSLSEAGKKVYVDDFAKQLLEAADDGPLTDAAAILLLRGVNREVSDVTERKLRRFSLVDFQNDYRSILAASPEWTAYLYDLTDGIGSLTSAEAGLLADYWPGLVEAWQYLHAAGDAPPEIALPAALDAAWEDFLRKQFQDYLYIAWIAKSAKQAQAEAGKKSAE